MQLFHGTRWPRRLAFYSLAISHLANTARADCAPATWDNCEFEATGCPGIPDPQSPTPSPVPVSGIITTGYIAPGEVNCRYDTNTEDWEINEHTCSAIAEKYRITLKTFFVLNPGLHSDCRNIEANTYYCVAGCKFSRNIHRRVYRVPVFAWHETDDSHLYSHRASASLRWQLRASKQQCYVSRSRNGTVLQFKDVEMRQLNVSLHCPERKPCFKSTNTMSAIQRRLRTRNLLWRHMLGRFCLHHGWKLRRAAWLEVVRWCLGQLLQRSREVRFWTWLLRIRQVSVRRVLVEWGLLKDFGLRTSMPKRPREPLVEIINLRIHLFWYENRTEPSVR